MYKNTMYIILGILKGKQLQTQVCRGRIADQLFLGTNPGAHSNHNSDYSAGYLQVAAYDPEHCSHIRAARQVLYSPIRLLCYKY